MSKYVKINENEDIKLNKQIKEYLSPDYIYIPYEKDSKLNVKDNEEIKKNSIILFNKDKFIYSSVSGTVNGICEMLVDNEKKKTIVIENDFKESSITNINSKNDILNLTKDEVKKLLAKYGAFEGSLDGNILLINGIDYEVYEETYSYLIEEHTESILECIDALINILGIHKCFFAIKNNDSRNVETLLNQIGTYPNIELKLIPDIYPIGYKDLIIKKLVIDSKINDTIYMTVLDVYNIYLCLKKSNPITEKLVTITGNLLNKSKVLNVKIGTNLNDIITSEFKILSDDYHIIINGLLSGYEVNTLNTIITPNVRSIFINSLSNVKPCKCINCGLCNINCPVNANPRTGKNMDKCIKCGLCNYLCPSRIMLVGDKCE